MMKTSYDLWVYSNKPKEVTTMVVAGNLGEYVILKDSDLRSLYFLLKVDSSDLLPGMVYNCDTPGRGASHNRSERCHR